MKKNNSLIKFSVIGFLLFFITIAITSTASIFVYYIATKTTNGNTLIISLCVVLTIAMGAVFCALIDIIRRRRMIEEPVEKILEATQKIASGDFNVKILHTHDYNKFNEYDVIFENINLMAKELSKTEILKNDFISNVSHEIKTPLAIIQNYSKLLQSKDITEQKKQEYLKGLQVQTNKLSNLITNILKLNKLENQKIVPEIEEFDLTEHLRLCALSFENLFDKKNIELICDLDEVKITSSKNLLEIVFNNLISNAIKFTQENGKISISLKQSKNIVTIKVKDTGCGISKEVGDHIFEKFYQGDTSHSSEGNGLGLALVKKVIDIIGGEIDVKSSLGVGSTFTIKLKKDNV